MVSLGLRDYLRYLESTGKTVHYAGSVPWVGYRGFLQPAVPVPFSLPTFEPDALEQLLRKTRVPFLRWTNHFTQTLTEWWWVTCEAPFHPELLSPGTRSKISRGLRRCAVRRIEPAWLAQHGYACHRAAFRRYKGVQPKSAKEFRRNAEAKNGFSCFELWGAFIDDKLIAYYECIVIDGKVSTDITEFDPDYFGAHYPAYAFNHTILNHYLNERGMRLVSNSMRSIAHDTAMQDFLLKFGFKKAYCRLNVLYSPWMSAAIRCSYPLRGLIGVASRLWPSGVFPLVDHLLVQETILRTFNGRLS